MSICNCLVSSSPTSILPENITHLISPLNHPLLPFHLHNLLFLGIRQRPRNTDKESAGTEDPQRLSAEHDARLGERCDRRDGAGDLATGVGRDDVFQRIDAVEQ